MERGASAPLFICIRLSRMRILVAEDDAILADGVTRTLRQSGYAVDWVNNGAEADSALDTDNFDLLILDIGLPKVPGLDVLKRLRAIRACPC